jgi:protein TonB
MNTVVRDQNFQRSSTLLLLVCIVLVSVSASGAKTLETRGLAVYTETSRDIYIAGLLAPTSASLDNVLVTPGPKAMEYRIATRRLSSRGFAGMLMLQAELGSGFRAPAHVISSLTQLKKSMRGALVRGDHFVISLAATNTTSFHLNKVELLKVKDRSVFDFFLAGWVGESSSALLRENLLAPEPAPEMMARFDELQPAPERVAIIAKWMAQPAPPNPAPAASIRKPAKSAKRVAAVAVAVTKPTLVVTPKEPQLSEKEYNRQITDYSRSIRTSVFKAVKYPRRAVKHRREGKVELLIYLDADGALIELTLATSSGYSPLDTAALRAVHKAAPFPELTPAVREEFVSADGKSYVMPIPVTFRLEN